MITNWLRLVIEGTAGHIGLTPWSYRGQHYEPGEWFEGLFLHESAGGKWDARRYEPHQDQKPDADRPGVDDGATEDDASRGLGQIMGYTARDVLGLPERCSHGGPILYNYSFLDRPVLSVSMAATVLHRRIAEVKRLNPQAGADEVIERALCRYNGGAFGDSQVSGDYRLRRYIDRIAASSKMVQENRITEGWRVVLLP